MSYIKCTNCGQNNNIDRTSCLCCRNDLARVDNPLTSVQIKRIKRIQKFMLSNMICIIVLIILFFTSIFSLLILILLYVSVSIFLCSEKVEDIFKARGHESFCGVCIIIRKFWITNIIYTVPTLLYVLVSITFYKISFYLSPASPYPVQLKPTMAFLISKFDNFEMFILFPISIAWLFYTLVYSLWRWFEIDLNLDLICQNTDLKNIQPSLRCNRFAILCSFFFLIILESIIFLFLPR